MPEAPWPAGPVDATLTWEPPADGPEWEGVGVLWFLSPETEGWHAGRRCPIKVSKSVPDAGTVIGRSNVWKIEDDGDGTVTVRPSVHFVDHFHSPNPARFRVVDRFADRDDG